MWRREVHQGSRRVNLIGNQVTAIVSLLFKIDLSPAVLTLVMNTQGSCLKLPSELPSILASSGPSSAGLFHLPSRLLGQSVQR